MLMMDGIAKYCFHYNKRSILFGIPRHSCRSIFITHAKCDWNFPLPKRIEEDVMEDDFLEFSTLLCGKQWENFFLCVQENWHISALIKMSTDVALTIIFPPDKGVNINNKFPRSRNCCLCHPFGGLYQRQSQPYILSFAMCSSVPRGHPESPNSMLLFFNWIFSHFLSFFHASLPYDPLLYCSISPLLAVVTRTCHLSFPTTAAFFLPN